MPTKQCGGAVDVDGVGAVEVDVLVVGRPDMCEYLVVDVSASPPEGDDDEAVVFGGPGDDGVGGQGQAPHLFGLLLMVPAADGTFASVDEGSA